MKKSLLLLIGLFVFIATCGRVSAQERRIALLIANQAYDSSVGRLANPHNDIALVADALREQGFEILPMIKDAGRSQMLQGVRQLVSQLNAAGSGSIGFVYYSGHGAAERETGTNYLIPVDAREPGTTTFWDDSLKLDDVLRLLERASGATKFVIFDACRNELRLPSRDTSKGLARVTENHGLFVAYSAAPGQTASDRGVGSGPYAAALAAELRKPGLDHLNLFQNVKEQVITTTGGAQHPWESNGLSRRVYLTGRPQAAQSAFPATVGGQGPNSNSGIAATREMTALSEAALWDTLKASNDAAAIEQYLLRFPAGAFAQSAWQRLDELRAKSSAETPTQPAAASSPVVTAMAAPVPSVRAEPRVRLRPRCDDGERLVNGRCVEIARKKKSKVREIVLKSSPVRVRARAAERQAVREARPSRPAAAPASQRMCFNSSTTGRGVAMVPCDDPRAQR